jgi:TPR repeat protein
MSLEVKDCPSPWDDLYIHLNGDVKPCCYSLGAFGSLVQGDSLFEIAISPEREELQAYTLANRIHPLCAFAGCTYIRGRAADVDEAVQFADAVEDADGLALDAAAVQGAGFGQPKNIFLLGHALWQAQRWEKALKWYRRGADLNEVNSLYSIGEAWLFGWGFPAPDPGRAYWAFQTAADLGHARSMMWLGDMMARGRIGVRDVDGGVELIRTAAKQGERDAWARLADLIEQGFATSKDPVRDVERYRERAATPL